MSPSSVSEIALREIIQRNRHPLDAVENDNMAVGLSRAFIHIKPIIYTNVCFIFCKLQEIKNTLKTLSPSNPV